MKQYPYDLKESYETPMIEIIEFLLQDTIALSTDFGVDTMCGEEIIGG